jgi:hypothetical protein
MASMAGAALLELRGHSKTAVWPRLRKYCVELTRRAR